MLASDARAAQHVHEHQACLVVCTTTGRFESGATKILSRAVAVFAAAVSLIRLTFSGLRHINPLPDVGFFFFKKKYMDVHHTSPASSQAALQPRRSSLKIFDFEQMSTSGCGLWGESRQFLSDGIPPPNQPQRGTLRHQTRHVNLTPQMSAFGEV